MKFEDALKAMRDGKRVKHGASHNHYFIISNNIMSCIPSYNNGKELRLAFFAPAVQLLREDWEILD